VILWNGFDHVDLYICWYVADFLSDLVSSLSQSGSVMSSVMFALCVGMLSLSWNVIAICCYVNVVIVIITVNILGCKVGCC